MYIYTIENNIEGVFNAVAPEHHTSKTFSKALAKNINRHFIGVNVPSFALKLMFGDMYQILLKGSRLSSKKIEKNGYPFRFKILNKALSNL